MKSVVNRIIVALLLVTMTSVAAFAKSKKTNVTFTVDTKVNETLVKSGTYEAVLNEETGELSILKGGKVVAKTATQMKCVIAKVARPRFTLSKTAIRLHLSVLPSVAVSSR